MSENETRYGIQELAQLGGVSRRTVRYYVQRGLLPAPTGTGRGKHYTQEHLEVLRRVCALQQAGVPLAHIPDVLAGKRPEPTQDQVPSEQGGESATGGLAEGAIWTRFGLAHDVELHIKGGPALGQHELETLKSLILPVIRRASLGEAEDAHKGEDDG